LTSGRPALDDLGILDLVDAVVLSFEVGMVEPDPRIFRFVEDALGLDPAECLLIGDKSHRRWRSRPSGHVGARRADGRGRAAARCGRCSVRLGAPVVR